MIIDPYAWSRHRIESITHVASDTVAVGFKRPPGYQFRAGQYAVVRITNNDGGSYMRQYSFSSAPDEDRLELLIQHEPNGAASTWFYETARIDDEVELSQPLGNFTLDRKLDRPIVLIAGRVGIAPFVSMMRDAHGHRLSVLYSVRTRNQVCFPELLERHGATIVQTDVSPRISHTFLKNFITDRPIVYVCGSKQFVDSMTSALHTLRVPPGDIKRELFTLQ